MTRSELHMVRMLSTIVYYRACLRLALRSTPALLMLATKVVIPSPLLRPHGHEASRTRRRAFFSTPTTSPRKILCFSFCRIAARYECRWMGELHKMQTCSFEKDHTEKRALTHTSTDAPYIFRFRLTTLRARRACKECDLSTYLIVSTITRLRFTCLQTNWCSCRLGLNVPLPTKPCPSRNNRPSYFFPHGARGCFQ